MYNFVSLLGGTDIFVYIPPAIVTIKELILWVNLHDLRCLKAKQIM